MKRHTQVLHYKGNFHCPYCAGPEENKFAVLDEIKVTGCFHFSAEMPLFARVCTALCALFCFIPLNMSFYFGLLLQGSHGEETQENSEV